MYSLQIRQLVIICIDASAEEEPRVPPVDDLVLPELDEIRLVFLVSGSDEAMDLELLAGKKKGKGESTSPLSLIFSSSL